MHQCAFIYFWWSFARSFAGRCEYFLINGLLFYHLATGAFAVAAATATAAFCAAHSPRQWKDKIRFSFAQPGYSFGAVAPLFHFCFALFSSVC